MDKYDLSYEKRFLDLLGYEYIEDTPGKWKVLDDNKKEVGYIEAYQNVDEDGNSYNKDCEYIYHMVIDSDTISFDNERDYDEQIYFFDVKEGNYDVYLQLGDKHLLGTDNEFITIHNKESLKDHKIRKAICFSKDFDSPDYGIINSHVNGIGVELTYPINGYIVEENMWFRNKDFTVGNDFKYYEYKLHHHLENEDYGEGTGYEISSFLMRDDQDKLITKKDIFEKISEMKRKEKELNEEDIVVDKNNKLHLFINTIKRVFNITPKRKHYFPPEEDYPTNAKTPEEFAIEHGRGIEIFKQARALANQILPFKKDIIYDYYKDYIDEYNLGILFDEYEKVNTK